jgi:hypothetical protein
MQVLIVVCSFEAIPCSRAPRAQLTRALVLIYLHLQVMDRTCDRQNTVRLHRENDAPTGLYNHLKINDRVEFLLGPDRRGTGTIVEVLTAGHRKKQSDAKPIGVTSALYPEYIVELDGPIAGKTLDLPGSALTKLP